MSDEDSRAGETVPQQPVSYRDFNPRLSAYSEGDGAGTFKVSVEGQAPGGSMRPGTEVARTYDP